MEEYIESDIFGSESSCSSEQSIFYGENHSIILDYIECRVNRLFYILLFSGSVEVAKTKKIAVSELIFIKKLWDITLSAEHKKKLNTALLIASRLVIAVHEINRKNYQGMYKLEKLLMIVDIFENLPMETIKKIVNWLIVALE